MSINKYKAAQNSTGNPRQTEYRLLADVTKALMGLTEEVDKPHKGPDFFKVLDWNRRVWLVLQTDLASEGNQFPNDLKASLISISLWVDRHTRSVMQGKETIEPLIQINRTIMEGLNARAKSAAEQGSAKGTAETTI